MSDLFGSSDIGGDIVPNVLPEHIQPRRRDFLPWHRVRKEYVRTWQWSELTKRLIDRAWKNSLTFEAPAVGGSYSGRGGPVGQSIATRPLNCLFIPGDDLLDIRALHRDLDGTGCYIRYLGFNDAQGSDESKTRVYIAHNAVTSLREIFTDSQIAVDRFEQIASPRSRAYQLLREYGPYHVVNLDFCGSLLPVKGSHDKGYLTAIHQLLNYQFEHQPAKWLLFVTTEVEAGAIDEPSMRKLCGPTRENIDRHSDFSAELLQVFPHAALADDSGSIDVSHLDKEQTIRMFGIGLGKWLISICHDTRPGWTVKMRPSYRYDIPGHHGSVLLALAFEFKRNYLPPTDRSGVSRLVVPTPDFPDEKQCAFDMWEAVGKIDDVEEIIDRLNMRETLRDAQANLLALAGYDRDAYIEWVEGGEKIDYASRQ